MLAAAMNVNHMLWKTGPSATELEQVSLGWLRQWLGLPDEFFGMIHDTASTATLHAVIAAREAARHRHTRLARPPKAAVNKTPKAALNKTPKAALNKTPKTALKNSSFTPPGTPTSPSTAPRSAPVSAARISAIFPWMKTSACAPIC